MKKILILLFLCSSVLGSAQERMLLITNLVTQKEKVIKENKRIKIKTVSGGKLVGRLHIIDKNTISLRGVSISLTDLEMIKKHPLIGSIGHSIGSLALGAGTLILGAIASDSYLGGENASDVYLYTGVLATLGAIYMATQPINLFDKGHSINKKWRFEIKIKAMNLTPE